MIRKIVKMYILLKEICKFSAVSSKVSMVFIVLMEQIIFKIPVKPQKTPNS